MRLEDDDLYDYDGDSFNEDDAIQEVIQTLKPIAISEIQAETELEKVDWDIDVCIANLRKKHALKPSPTSSKPQSEPKGKLSALQLLQQRRSAQNSSLSADKPSAPSVQPSQPTKHSSTAQSHASTEVASTPNPAVSIPAPKKTLAEIAAERKARASASQPASQPVKSELSALDKLKQRRAQAKPASPGSDFGSGSGSGPGSGSGNNNKPATKQKPNVETWKPIMNYDIITCLRRKAPSVLGRMIGFKPYFPRNSLTNSFPVSKSAEQNFSKPSPDDFILNAQSPAFKANSKSKETQTAASKQQNGKPSTAPKTKETPVDVKEPKKQVELKKQAEPKKEAEPKTDIIAKLKSMKLKQSCSFVVMGHVDAGKSTLMGRLLLDTGALSQKTVNKFEHESSKAGKGSFWLAWALDATKEERERGVTVDIGEANFETDSTKFTVLDAPGHRDYVPNMISGVSNADIALLVVDSDTNAFESGFALDGQTTEHTVLARSLGIDTLVIAVNKMDNQHWAQDRYEDIKTQLTEFFTKKVGYSENKLTFIPTSGVHGENVVKERGPEWYQGPTVVDALDKFALELNANSNEKFSDSFRFVVSNSFIEAFQSTVTLLGRAISGVVEPRDNLQLVSNKAAEILEVKQVTGDYLKAGDQGEIKITASGDEVDIKPGDILTGLGDELRSTTKFVAKLRLFDTPRPVLPGTKLNFHLGRVDTTVKLISILESLDAKTTRGGKLRHLKKGSAAKVELELESPAVLAPPSVCKELSRFVLRFNGRTIGGGVVESCI